MYPEMELLNHVITEKTLREKVLVVCGRGIINETVETISNLSGIHFRDIVRTHMSEKDYTDGLSAITGALANFCELRNCFNIWKQEIEKQNYHVVLNTHEADSVWYSIEKALTEDQIDHVGKALVSDIALYFESHDEPIYSKLEGR